MATMYAHSGHGIRQNESDGGKFLVHLPVNDEHGVAVKQHFQALKLARSIDWHYGGPRLTTGYSNKCCSIRSTSH